MINLSHTGCHMASMSDTLDALNRNTQDNKNLGILWVFPFYLQVY